MPGHHYRLFVIDGRLVTAVRWMPARVAGDGVHTIEELLANANRDPGRGEAYGYDFDFGKKRARMAPNAEMMRMLGAQGYALSSVPTARPDRAPAWYDDYRIRRRRR